MQINEDAVREVLKQHFPEYISGSCLCGEPIETYMAWIDHVAALMFPQHPETFLDKGETNG